MSPVTPPANRPAWERTAPSPFCIATCFFPESEAPEIPGPVLRPALIYAVEANAARDKFACHVAFGTTKLKIAQRGDLDLIIQNAADLAFLNLPRATRFDLDKTGRLPWAEKYFGVWRGHTTPVLGHLTEPYVKAFAWGMFKRSQS